MDPVKLSNSVSLAAGIDRQAAENKPCTNNSDCAQYKDGSVCSKRKGKDAGYCVETWFGLCHAWGPASINELEPERYKNAFGLSHNFCLLRCPVVVNGIKFGIMDIKALLIQSYDQSNVETIFTAKRCQDANPEQDAFGRFVDPNCRDLTPDLFHLAMTNMIGKLQRPFIIDITSTAEVWNQPVFGYEVLKVMLLVDALNLILSF